MTPSSGTVTTSPTGAILTVAVNAVGMAPGVYQGHILIAGGNPTIDYIAQVTVTASGTTATITPSPTALTFSQVSGGALPASQTVTLTGSASTAYQATANVPWLTVNPASGTAATTGTALTVAVNSMSSTLGAGTFQATVTITGGATTATVGVTLTITNAATNAVTPTPSMLTFNSIAGGSSPGAQTVQLTSGATVNFTAASNQTWLLVNPTSGAITPTTAASLTVSVVTGSMGAGSYTGAITVTGGASPVSIPVTLNITAATTITPSPSSLTFVQLLGGAAPANQTVSLTAPTATPFSAAGTQPWLTVTSSATGTPATLTVAVNGATLAVGSYRDTITITGGSATVTIPVSLTILSGTGNAIVSDQAAVAFKQSLGDTSFKIQQVRLTALLPTSFTASSNVTWITVSPSDTATTPATLTLTEDPTGLAAGSYTGAVTVVGGVVPLTIQVLLTIATAPNAIAPTPTTVSFAQFLGGAAPVSQTVQLASATPTAFTVTNTQSWLTVTPSSGTTNTALTLAVSPSGLLAGTYQDTITVTGGALPITIPVSYTINPDTFLATPASLTFIQTLGGATPVAQSVQLTSALPHPFNITSNAAWLTVLPTTGTSPATLTVTANGAGLAAGTYNGALTVNGAGAPISIAATLTVAVASGPVFSPTSVTFSVAAGVTTPSTQTVTVSSQAAQFSFAATATVSNGSGGAVNWLSVSPATGTTPATLTITANPAGLASGQYAGIVTVTPTDGSIPTQNLSVILNIAGGSSTTFVKSVLSAGSFLPGPISPGELVTIFGLNLGPTAGVAATPLASGAIDIQLAGTQVLFDGVAAPILYAQAGQLNVIVPYNVYGRTTTSLQVSISGVLSTPVGLAVQNTAPAVFTVNSKGTGQSAVINQDGTLNGPNFPAAGKSVISIYGTGEGQTSPPGQDGRLISTDLRHPIATFSATVGNVPAQVQYMGSAPTLVSGVFQMNIVVPAGLTPGQQPLQITVGGVTTQVAITVAVK